MALAQTWTLAAVAAAPGCGGCAMALALAQERALAVVAAARS